MGKPHRRGVQRVLHRLQRLVAVSVPAPGHRPDRPAARPFPCPAAVADRSVTDASRPGGRSAALNSGLANRLPRSATCLRDVQAVQDLRLAGHHRFGRRILPQNALQFPQLVAARLVDQRTGRGVERRDLAQRKLGAEAAPAGSSPAASAAAGAPPTEIPAALHATAALLGQKAGCLRPPFGDWRPPGAIRGPVEHPCCSAFLGRARERSGPPAGVKMNAVVGRQSLIFR